MIRMYQIAVDGHFHGGPPPRPWVARIDGVDERYGLRREFIKSLNDFRDARVAWSGNTYGIVASFPLRAGHLYEVSRTRGKPSKRRVVREFYWLDEELVMQPRTPDEALAVAEGDAGDAMALRLHDGDTTWAAEVTGLGTPRRLGWVVVDGLRLYRLRHERLYEVREGGRQRLLRVGEGETVPLSEGEALAWLRERRAGAAA